MVIDQNVVVWNQKYQKHRATIFAMHVIFASIAKISLASEILLSYRKSQEIAKMENFARNSNFR